MGEYLRLLGTVIVRFSPLIEETYPLEEAEKRMFPFKKKNLLWLSFSLIQIPRQKYNSYPGKIPTAQPTQRKNKINVALVVQACSHRMSTFRIWQNYRNCVSLRAIVNRTGSTAGKLAQRYAADYATTDYAEVLSDAEIDAVIICSRHKCMLLKQYRPSGQERDLP